MHPELVCDIVICRGHNSIFLEIDFVCSSAGSACSTVLWCSVWELGTEA